MAQFHTTYESFDIQAKKIKTHDQSHDEFSSTQTFMDFDFRKAQKVL
jgi:hypothetical protein